MTEGSPLITRGYSIANLAVTRGYGGYQFYYKIKREVVYFSSAIVRHLGVWSRLALKMRRISRVTPLSTLRSKAD